MGGSWVREGKEEKRGSLTATLRRAICDGTATPDGRRRRGRSAERDGRRGDGETGSVLWRIGRGSFSCVAIRTSVRSCLRAWLAPAGSVGGCDQKLLEVRTDCAGGRGAGRGVSEKRKCGTVRATCEREAVIGLSLGLNSMKVYFIFTFSSLEDYILPL